MRGAPGIQAEPIYPEATVLDPHDEIARVDDRDAIEHALRHLEPRDRTILWESIGRQRTYRAIAKMVGLSLQRIAQREEKALRRVQRTG